MYKPSLLAGMLRALSSWALSDQRALNNRSSRLQSGCMAQGAYLND